MNMINNGIDFIKKKISLMDTLGDKYNVLVRHLNRWVRIPEQEIITTNV